MESYMNPNMKVNLNPNYNPNMNSNIQNINTNINPNMNSNMNPNMNPSLNPNMYRNSAPINYFNNPQGYPNENLNEIQAKNQILRNYPNQNPNQIQIQDNNLAYNPNLVINSNIESHFNERQNIYDQGDNQKIQYINQKEFVNERDFINQNQKKSLAYPLKDKKAREKKKIENVSSNEKQPQNQESSDVDNKESEPEKEEMSQKNLDIQKNDPNIGMSSIKTISHTISVQNSDNKLPILNNNEENNLPPNIDKDNNQPVEFINNHPKEMPKFLEDPMGNKKSEKPKEKENPDIYPFGPEYIELRANFLAPPSNKKKAQISPNQPYPFPYPNDQNPYQNSPNPYEYPYPFPNMPNYPQNEQELPKYPQKRPNSTKKYQNPRKKTKKPISPAKISPKYQPKNPLQPPNDVDIQDRASRYPMPKQQIRRSQSSRGPPMTAYDVYNPPFPYRGIYEYPRHYVDKRRGLGSSLSRSKSKSPSKEKTKSTANILFSYPTSGRCFACNVQCSISRSGNSPNKYVPYMASYKKLRKDITFYDGEKYGYYQYTSPYQEIPKNNN